MKDKLEANSGEDDIESVIKSSSFDKLIIDKALYYYEKVL